MVTVPDRPNIFRSPRTHVRRGSQFLPALATVAVLVLGPLALVAYACGGGGHGSWLSGGQGGSWSGNAGAGSGSQTPATPGLPDKPGAGAPDPATPDPGIPDPGNPDPGKPDPGTNPPPSPPSDPSAGSTDGPATGGEQQTPGQATEPSVPATQQPSTAPGGDTQPSGEIDQGDGQGGSSGARRHETDSSRGTGSQVAGIASSLAAPATATIIPAVAAVSSGESSARSAKSTRPARDPDQLRQRTTIARAVDGIPLVFRAALLLLIFATSVLAIVSLRERRRATAVARIALLDHLTGLANREGFDRQMAVEWQRAIRHDRPLGLVFVDLDDFKAFNDTFGHVAGDRLLREVAAAIVTTARASDFTARLGGDEFVVICPDAEEEGLDRLVERLRVESAGMAVSLSIGAASRLAEDQSSDDLVHRADVAMYRAKGGRRRGTSTTNPMLGSLRRS